MSEPVCIGGLYRFIDEATGEVYEVPVSVDIATAIADLDATEARRERSHKKRTRSLSALTGIEGCDHDPIDPRSVASHWEGPRFAFTLWVGMGRAWGGPDERDEDGDCPCCHGRELGTSHYCLGCDRSGWDDMIPKPVTVAKTMAVAKLKPRTKTKKLRKVAI